MVVCVLKQRCLSSQKKSLLFFTDFDKKTKTHYTDQFE